MGACLGCVPDAAIIALAWSTGLRRDEISRIELHELVNKTDDGLDIAMVGKGGKVRAVYVNDGAHAALLYWLELRGLEPGALFVNVNAGGKLTGGRLSGEPSARCWRSEASRRQAVKVLHVPYSRK